MRRRGDDHPPIRLVDVARRLSVSPSTVSRAFNAPWLLRPETVRSVLGTAEEMGYVPNRHAQALITGRTGAIGLVLPDITNPFFPPMIRAAQHRAGRDGLNVFVAESGNDQEAERRVIASLLPQCEGIVVASSRLPAAELIMLARRAPLVLINNDAAGVARVLLSSRAALEQAIIGFADDGVRRLGYVGGPRRSWSEHERRSAVRAVADQRGLVVTGTATETGTYAEARGLVEELITADVEAIVAFDDVVAHGVLDGLIDHGVRIPDRIRLLGCDDALPIQTHPRLSTVTLPVAEGITVAVGLLLEHRGALVPETRIELAGSLELRETT